MEKTTCKVLIVDDEYIIRQGIAYIVDWEKEGFSIVGEASNGEEALEKIEALHPDIVLSDIVMPKLDGLDLTKKIQQSYPDIRVIILSSYSDFDYVRNTFQNGAVDYILKPTLNPAELLKVLRKAAASIPSLTIQSSQNRHLATQLSQYILGFSSTLEQEIQAQFAGNSYYLLISNQKFYKEVSLCQQFFETTLFTEKNRLHPCIIRLPNDVMAALLCTTNTKLEVKEILTSLLLQNPILKASGFFVLSDQFFDLSAIKTVYEEASEKLRSRFYQRHHLIYEEPLRKTESIKFDQRLFTSKLDAMQLSEALDLLDAYIKEAVNNQLVSEETLKPFTGNSLYTLIGILEDHNLNEESVRHFKLNCINLLESATYADDFLEQLEAIYQDFKIIFKNYELDQHNNQLMQYISQHYAEVITLQSLAEKFGFSYHYLSTYFATQANETFVECLNRIRIEKACTLLNETSLSISEVGCKVGYSDHSYFCKVFKKATGMTPSAYKKR